jgi:hypothetical protein
LNENSKQVRNWLEIKKRLWETFSRYEVHGFGFSKLGKLLWYVD